MTAERRTTATNSIARKAIAAAMLSVAVVFLSITLTATKGASHKDFISYWAAGQLLVHHHNPYSPAAVFGLQKSAGLLLSYPMIMRNPPHALVLTLPLGFVGSDAAAILWTLLMMLSFVVSIRLLANLHGKLADSLHLFGYLFAPVLASLIFGQTSAFILLGLTLFLYNHERRPGLSGAALFLLTIKPQLFLPFAIVLASWLLARRKYQIALAFSGTFMACALLPAVLVPSVWSDYSSVFKAANEESFLMPTFSTVIRVMLGRCHAWPQYLPAICGMTWAAWYYWRNQRTWNWRTNGSLVLMVSVLVAPYSWLYDEAVLLPAIFAGLYANQNENKCLIAFCVPNGVAILAVIFGITAGSGFFIWTTLAWLLWYVYAIRLSRYQQPARTY